MEAFPALYLYPLNDTFIPKQLALGGGVRLKIGRQTNAKTVPGERNGFFDAKVVSRQHAEAWEEDGKIYIKDVKSSNGTFVNGDRLSPESIESDSCELKSEDIVEFGIDIVGEDNRTIIHHKVVTRVRVVLTPEDAHAAAREHHAHLMHIQQLLLQNQSAQRAQTMAPDPLSAPDLQDSVAAQSTVPLIQVAAEIASVPLLGPLAESLKPVFEMAERARVNKAQWKLLQGRCVMVLRIAGSRVATHGQESYPELERAAFTLKITFDTIGARARHYNEMDQSTGFLQFEVMSEEIKNMFGTLDSCLTMFSFTIDVAQSQWVNEFRIAQEQELATLTSIRKKLLGRNKDSKHCKEDGTQTTTKTRTESLRSKGMSAQEMFECLKRHGCQDLSERVDMKTMSVHAVVTGAYGDIFKGVLDDGTDIAIKVWNFRRAQEAPHKCSKGAMRELYNWSKADHENIQKLLGVFMFKDRLGMVSKWMANGDLQGYIQKHQPKDRYRLCTQVAKAVQHLHKEQMVHGDLKACNFLVSSDGVVKLTDFDHSIISCHSIVFSQTTTMGGGTMRWMAPELAMDEGEVELRSTQADVYALGMTMLEIITGAVPYLECQSDQQIFYKLQDKVLPERKEKFQDARGDRMWELLVQCWNHDPALRPSADKVVDSLQSLILVTILPNDGVVG